MIHVRRESDIPSGRGTWGLDYDMDKIVRPTIPGSIAIKAAFGYGGYHYVLPIEQIKEALSLNPHVVRNNSYGSLLLNSRTDASNDCFYNIGIYAAPYGKFGQVVAAVISPVVVNYDHFQLGNNVDITPQMQVLEDDFTDIIPFAVKRSDYEIEIALSNFHDFYEALFHSRDLKQFIKDAEIHAEVETMETALYFGKLARYLEFYRRIEKPNSPILNRQEQALNILRDRYKQFSLKVIFNRRPQKDDFSRWQSKQKKNGITYTLKDIPPVQDENITFSDESPLLNS